MPGHQLCVAEEFVLSPKAAVAVEDHSVFSLPANWLGSKWKAQDPGMDRGFVLIFNESASVEMPKTNVCICLPVRIKLNQPVSRTPAQGVKRAPDPPMGSSWAEPTLELETSVTVHLESESLSVFTGELQSSSDGEEKGDLSVYTLLYVSPENSTQGCCWGGNPHKNSVLQDVKHCLLKDLDMDLG